MLISVKRKIDTLSSVWSGTMAGDQSKRLICQHLDAVKLSLWWDLVDVINEACQQARRNVQDSEFIEEVRAQALGSIRHAMVTSLLKHRFENVEEGVTVVTEKAESSWGFYYAVLKVKTQHSLLMLTVKATDAPSILPEKSNYRKKHAACNQFLPLLEEIGWSQSSQAHEEKTNILITYKLDAQGNPEEIWVLMPNSSYSGVIDHEDLLKYIHNREKQESFIKRRSTQEIIAERQATQIKKNPLQIKKAE